MGETAAQPASASQPGAPCATIVTDWRANGTAESDLPTWVARACAAGGSVASASVPARLLRGEDLESAAFSAFSQAFAALAASPCRVWAFIPDPTGADDAGLDRYMRANIGRTRAYRESPHALMTTPAGTCTGHHGDHLVVHALHMPGSNRAVENPRQRPAWSYSARFGPSPPPFARGMVAGGLLMASGTASVVGEESVHHEDLDAQWVESLVNLQALAECAGTHAGWRSLQIYVRERSHLDRVATLATAAFAEAPERILHAPLCRRELLVEIEAAADAR